MDDKLQPAADALVERFAAQASEFRGEVTLQLGADKIVAACQALRDEFGFDMLIDETAVDYWPAQTARFHLVYHVYSMKSAAVLCLRVALDGNAPHIPTVETVYPVANWHEREVYDMFGITFDGHSDPRRILMPQDWEGHPLRKDYPVGYEEVQFTFNVEEIDLRKPYAKD
jgi:NADH-quinone oxidoreductase subunit C